MRHELPDGFQKDVVGYCDPLSVLPGSRIGFKFSAWNQAVDQTASCQVVELISGDDRPHGTGLIERALDIEVDDFALVHQPLRPGSYAHIENVPGASAACLGLRFFPTLLRESYQCLLAWGELRLEVSNAGVRAVTGDLVLNMEQSMLSHRWYELRLVLGAQAELKLERLSEYRAEPGLAKTITGVSLHAPEAADLYLACNALRATHFNGRLENPWLAGGEGDIARWDFAQDIASQQIVDVSGNGLHGILCQNPTRAVTGSLWRSDVQNYQDAPEQYAAIHFHEDNLTDAEWRDSVVLQVPEDLTSGQYALKVSVGDDLDYVPFFVKAPRNQRRDLAYLVPTASYLAYANQRMGLIDGPFGSPKIFDANQAFLKSHADLGDSMYEHHADWSGVHFSSRLRPVMNMKPMNPTWQFNADTHLTAWLHHMEQDFDVLTDEDLHLEGAAALEGYRTVITGTHPEYYSTAMRDGLSSWLGQGGRLMYMGGNGFYWRVAFQPDNPAIMEVRRAEDGTRAWIAEPGEYYHQFGGEYGGMWRRLGLPPNELVGIGFAAQGFDGGTHYRLQPGALNPRAAFIMAGIGAGVQQVIGDYGNQGGGAAGEEIDRWDASLGSPAHAVILAQSEGHRPGMLRVKEEFHMMEYPDREDPKVRADMVFFEVPGGGAVFSTGSISYAGSLAHNNYDNDIERLTANVLHRFLDATPFEMPDS